MTFQDFKCFRSLVQAFHHLSSTWQSSPIGRLTSHMLTSHFGLDFSSRASYRYTQKSTSNCVKVPRKMSTCYNPFTAEEFQVIRKPFHILGSPIFRDLERGILPSLAADKELFPRRLDMKIGKIADSKQPSRLSYLRKEQSPSGHAFHRNIVGLPGLAIVGQLPLLTCHVCLPHYLNSLSVFVFVCVLV